MPTKRKCENCGRDFVPASGNQRYCSEPCAEAAKERQRKRRQGFDRAVKPVLALQQQEYLSFSRAAILMGCSRQYIYKLVGQGRLPASRLSSRMSLVRRSDIDKLLADSPYERVIPVSREGIAESPTPSRKQAKLPSEPLQYYTAEEVITAYKVRKSWLYTCAKRFRVKTCRIAGRTYFDKGDIDRHFGCAVDTSAIADWITTEEAASLYGMKPGSVHSYAHRHRIPAKREYGVTYYSKSHFDALRRTDLATDDRYMGVEEIQRRYGLTKANIHHIAKVNGIGKIKVGVRNLLLRADVERVMAERVAKGLAVGGENTVNRELSPTTAITAV